MITALSTAQMRLDSWSHSKNASKAALLSQI
jgi:hypothetical protein